MVTDYDCWRETGEAVNVEKVLAVLKMNIENVKKLIVKAVGNIENNRNWEEVIKANKVTELAFRVFRTFFVLQTSNKNIGQY